MAQLVNMFELPCIWYKWVSAWLVCVADTWKVWELKLYFYPSAGGLIKENKTLSVHHVKYQPRRYGRQWMTRPGPASVFSVIIGNTLIIRD